MKLKKKPVAGVCHANRCTAAEGLTEPQAGVFLCPKHADKPIEVPAPAAPGAPLAGVPDTGYIMAEVVGPIEAEAEALRARVESVQIVIQDKAQLDAIGALAAHAQKKVKEIEAQRTSITKPLLDAKRRIDDLFNPAKAAYKAVKDVAQAAMSTYVTARNAERAAALAAGDHGTAMAAAPAALPAGTSVRRSWTFEVVDAAAVPAEFLITSIDAAKVQAVVNEQREKTAIPGIRAYEAETLVTRGS